MHADPAVLVVRKDAPGSAALVLLYLGSQERDFQWSSPGFRPALDGRYRSALGAGTLDVQGNAFTCRLQPYDVQIWIKE